MLDSVKCQDDTVACPPIDMSNTNLSHMSVTLPPLPSRTKSPIQLPNSKDGLDRRWMEDLGSLDINILDPFKLAYSQVF